MTEEAKKEDKKPLKERDPFDQIMAVTKLCKRNLDKIDLAQAEVVVRHLHEHIQAELRRRKPQPPNQAPVQSALPGFDD